MKIGDGIEPEPLRRVPGRFYRPSNLHGTLMGRGIESSPAPTRLDDVAVEERTADSTPMKETPMSTCCKDDQTDDAGCCSSATTADTSATTADTSATTADTCLLYTSDAADDL